MYIAEDLLRGALRDAGYYIAEIVCDEGAVPRFVLNALSIRRVTAADLDIMVLTL